ncbi:O-acetyl-ADP-ribose deacetylase [Anaerococcus octavius]|uniref:O-acetyl-ADP-ribose deacetylase n=2 Tax=Anaerococcus TaxID=165779 RepID=A0A380WU89_9FIRM|nr:macro domain-containing protein [Anaerococcus octavius]SUU91884.1 O-acetyl-ADP-ribose deacetylase [Anaerococcus octavius]
MLVIQIRNGRTIASSKIPKKGIISFIKSAGITAYRNSLKLSKEKGIKSIAFPLISAGIYGFPEKDAFFVAKRTIDEFLKDNEMEVYLSTFVKDILSLIMG